MRVTELYKISVDDFRISCNFHFSGREAAFKQLQNYNIMNTYTLTFDNLTYVQTGYLFGTLEWTVRAVDAEGAQEQAVDEIEAQGLCHGNILSIKRSTPAETLATYYLCGDMVFIGVEGGVRVVFDGEGSLPYGDYIPDADFLFYVVDSTTQHPAADFTNADPYYQRELTETVSGKLINN